MDTDEHGFLFWVVFITTEYSEYTKILSMVVAWVEEIARGLAIWSVGFPIDLADWSEKNSSWP